MSSVPVHLVGISGSLRAGGNTEQVLDYAAAVAATRGATFSVLPLREYRIHPCGTCGDCNAKDTPCERTDDDMPQLLDELIAADGIVYAAPVYGFGLAHLLQIFIERAGVCFLRFKRPLANKVGGVVVTGRRYNHGHVHAQIVQNLLLNRMILVGSGFPAVVHGGGHSEARRDSEGMDAVRRMVNRMIDMVRMMKQYRRAFSQEPLACEDENERARQSILDR